MSLLLLLLLLLLLRVRLHLRLLHEMVEPAWSWAMRAAAYVLLTTAMPRIDGQSRSPQRWCWRLVQQQARVL
jgi:hypothetical protein